MFAVVVEETQIQRAASPENGYWAVSRGPLASLAFVLPLLAVYEAGVWGLGPQAVRNGADLWLRGLLDALGFGQYLLLPALTVVLLLTWHHLSAQPWRLPWRVIPGMAAESMALAMCLVVLAQLQGAACQAIGIPAQETPAPRANQRAEKAEGTRAGRELFAASVTSPAAAPGNAARLIAFLGAGIYEEVLFRLMLLPVCAAAFTRLGLARARSLLAAVILTSLIFSLAHYVGPHGDRWQSFSFLFRAVAGAFFAVLFVQRGFGVAAGAHAGYDILVGLA